jgi:hypothetical protein
LLAKTDVRAYIRIVGMEFGLNARRRHDISAKLGAINRTLERQNEIAVEVLGVVRKPKNRWVGTLETIVLVVGVLGILNIAELVRRWIYGG